ncbi:hypothetical protein PC39_03992 [Salinisphaera sp. PC39]|uniref:surface carbohydrate biosynthesis protein n=1 Tax=Salinisphaera sp. PC39 TaxID=1304156 RepID=UPI0033403834
MRRHGPLRWLLLPVETKHRELDAKLWLGCCAVERGYGVILGEMDELHEKYLALPRGICLDKSIASGKLKALRRMHRAGYRLCVNDEEALMAYNYPQRFLDSRLSSESLSMTAFFFAWGERQAELVRGAYPEYADRVHTVGNPRVDLLATQLRELYAGEANGIRERIGRYILLPSNFCDLLHVNGPDFRLKQARAAGLVRNEDDVRMHAERRVHRQRVLDAFVEALHSIRHRFPDHALVVRPHPADDPDQWRHLVAGIDRCQVLYEGAAIPWLLGADAIFHNGCTTAVEAVLLGKRPISYHPFWDDRFEYHFQARVGSSVDKIESLLDILRTVIEAEPEERQADDRGLGRYIRVTPDRTAAEATLDLLARLESKPRRLEYTWLNPNYARSRILAAGKRLERRLRRRLRRQPIAERKPEPLKLQKWPSTALGEMEERLQRLRDVSGRFSDVRVTHLEGRLFILTSDTQS